jgi:hypothetical protein
MTCPRSVGAAADHVDGRRACGSLEQHATDPGVQRNGVGLTHASGVGEDEAGRAGPVEAGSDLVGVEDGHDGDVVHSLGSGGVVVEHGYPAARFGQRFLDALPGVRLHPHRGESGEVCGQVRHGHSHPLCWSGQEIWSPPLTS